ncbi:MAG: AbrB/MazE/SpoVT family DNA-binding domain-containing protein [Holophaga sp.]|nr:AbrB/MazE/SpoVT family DNA-binding domain-containing protein [Holophaga sp.]
MRNELARSKVTSQDQISVPLEVRKRFGIKSGCELGWYEENGRLYVDLTRVHTLADARAALGGRRTARPELDVKAAIKARVAEKFTRESR